MTEKTETEEALALVEAHRLETREPELEEGMSIKDWMDRVQGAAKTSFLCARAGEHNEEMQATTEMASYALGRLEQLVRFARQAECEHDYRANARPDERCSQCGLMHGEWNQYGTVLR